MKRQAINSENLASAGYDEATQTMEVEFDQRGAVYRYSNLPKSVWDAFLVGQPSPGKYFYHNIRSSYPYMQVSSAVK